MSDNKPITEIYRLSDKDLDMDQPITLIIQTDWDDGCNVYSAESPETCSLDLMKQVVHYLVPYGEVDGEFAVSRVLVLSDKSTLMFTTNNHSVSTCHRTYKEATNCFYIRTRSFVQLWDDYIHPIPTRSAHIPFITFLKESIGNGAPRGGSD